MTENQRAFLVGLAKLTRETGVKIGACGCCSSPFLIETEQGELDERAGYSCDSQAECVKWVSPHDAYDWEECADAIVR